MFKNTNHVSKRNKPNIKNFKKVGALKSLEILLSTWEGKPDGKHVVKEVKGLLASLLSTHQKIRSLFHSVSKTLFGYIYAVHQSRKVYTYSTSK